MTQDQRRKGDLIDSFRQQYKGTQGGIFSQVTREKILTGEGISGKGRPKNQFWYHQRENVKTALLDLCLFVEFAGDDNVDKVVTKEALKRLVGALLRDTVFPYSTQLHHKSPYDLKIKRAEIADLFIRSGFDYFEFVGSDMTLSHKRTMDEAIDLSNYLLRKLSEHKETKGEDQ
jgi:hypothetical protein